MDLPKSMKTLKNEGSSIEKHLVSLKDNITNFALSAITAAKSVFGTKLTDRAEDRRKIYFGGFKDKRFDFTKYPPLLPAPERLDEAVKRESSFFVNAQGQVLHAQKWRTAQPTPGGAKAIVGFVHGYSTPAFFHYERVCRCLAAEGFVVVALDGRGHGLSDGLCAFIDDAEAYADDHRRFFAQAAREHEGSN